ncbi:MAG: hypothetical protein IJU40_07270, partial [Desulfovibrionaceae bacterium]|nr:hypothetical protein [Desulfovibrionaceae bacterium]
MYNFRFKPYVTVAEKAAKAQKKIQQLRRQGLIINPIPAFTGAIAKTFWGKNWCENIETYADFDNRLGRGRSYVRNGFICHLEISQGLIEAKVNGTSLYDVKVKIKTLDPQRWKQICRRCQGHISSLLELLQGKFSKEVMAIVSDPETGIFPKRNEISYECS